MSDFKPLKNAMIAIAVSSYKGGYSDLPGTQISAKRMMDWAGINSPDRNYDILDLTSDTHGELTVDFLRREINEFLDTRYIDRLIVYFAGHGIVRSDADQFWLLSRAGIDEREGIDVRPFLRGLSKSGLGSSNPDIFGGQLCVIADACRNPDKSGIDFKGDAIVTRAGKRKNVQIDQFFATTIGEYAFQANATDNSEPYCLFSQVFLEGVTGANRNTVESVYHPYKPAVINDKLADFLENEVPKRAKKYGEVMEPDVYPSIRAPNNYYAILGSDCSSNKEFHDSNSFEMAPSGNRVPKARQSEAVLTDKTRLNNYTVSTVLDNLVSEEYLELEGILIPTSNRIARASNSKLIVDNTLKGFSHISATIWENGEPLLVRDETGWVIVPFYPNCLSVVHSALPGDVLIRRHSNIINSSMSKWDFALSDESQREGAMPKKISDILELADSIRVGKELYPNNAVSAAYMYEFAGDIDNIARTAHYMALSGLLPFDVAMLCADRLSWKRDENQVSVFADLPSVVQAEEGSDLGEDENRRRPNYAYQGFEERKGVRVFGIVPTRRQGWKFLEAETHLNPPRKLIEISRGIAGRSAAILPDSLAKVFFDFFNYRDTL